MDAAGSQTPPGRRTAGTHADRARLGAAACVAILAAAAVAMIVRAEWRLPSGPVDAVRAGELAESAGAEPRGTTRRTRAATMQRAPAPPRAERLVRAPDVADAESRSTRIVEGVVFQPDGSPAAHANVAIGAQGDVCDAHGRFRIACGPEVSDDACLVAFVPGVQPAVLERFGTRLPPPGRAGTVGPVRLDLGPPALSIDGVVVDARGAGQKGWSVRLRASDAPRTVLGRPLEELVAAGQRTARTDRDGGFVLGGLLPRRYELLATRGGRRIVVPFDPSDRSSLRVVVPDRP